MMDGYGDTERILDEALLRTVARRLGRLTRTGTVSVFPAEKSASVVASLDLQYYPEPFDEVTLEVRAYTDGSFFVTYRERRAGEDWMCRWDRHDNPHSSRDHFHQPPDAHTDDAVDRDFDEDFLDVLETVLDAIDDRLGTVWE
jgi:hypothetical protein